MTTPWRLNKFIIYYTFIVDRICFNYIHQEKISYSITATKHIQTSI